MSTKIYQPRKPAVTFEGEPCVKCGSTLRYVVKGRKKGRCVACMKARDQKPYNKERRRKYMAEHTDENREYQRQYTKRPKAAVRRKAYDKDYRSRPGVQDRFNKRINAYRSTERGKQQVQDYRQDPDVWLRRKEYQLLRQYGMTIADLNTRLDAQHNLCAICDKTLNKDTRTRGKVDRVCVDHDHDTGAVRGLLCSTCNLMIGLAKDNPLILRNAAQYLDGDRQ